MKRLILALALVMAGCSSSKYDNVTCHNSLREAHTKLDSCIRTELSLQSKLEFCENRAHHLDTTPPEPQYEEREVFEVDGTTCETREEEACGVLFTDCRNGTVYRCMTNVKYKVKVERVKTE